MVDVNSFSLTLLNITAASQHSVGLEDGRIYLMFFKLNLFNFYSLSALGGEDRPARHVRKVLFHPGSNFSHQDASPNPEAAKQTSEHNQN